jgi:3-oxoacyl-[acyl-carrier protein] reductase
MISLGGKKALITGGSRGIGEATAILFARAGCDVAFSYVKNEDAAKSVAKKVKDSGADCLFFKTDLSRKTDIVLMVDRLMDHWGKIDVVVNNAGIWTDGEIGSMEERIWRETMAVNLDAVFFLCSAVVPHMKKTRKGWIVNVASTAGVRGEAGHSHYAASKGALISLTKSLAVELAPYGIRVNCVSPGWVDTDMCTGVFNKPGYRSDVEKGIPLGRIAAPEDIAGPILFLVSDLALHITGENVNVNGGSVLCG